MTIGTIANRETGLSVRTKLNQAIGEANNSASHRADTSIHFEDVPAADNIPYYRKNQAWHRLQPANDFSYKATATTPIYLAVLGQSNALGPGAPSDASLYPQTPNPNVFVWQPDSDFTYDYAYEGYNLIDPANCSWVVADPNAAQAAAWNGSGFNVGLPGGGSANAGFAWADLLQRITGRPVYVVIIARSGTPINFWDPVDWGTGNPGPCWKSTELHLDASLAALQAIDPSITHLDGTFWHQGEANISSPWREYIEKFEEIQDTIDEMTAFTGSGPETPVRWGHRRRNRWYFGGIYQPSPNATIEASRLNELASMMTSKRTRFISSQGMLAYDQLHFWGEYNLEFGELMARDMLFGAGPIDYTPVLWDLGDSKSALDYPWTFSGISGSAPTAAGPFASYWNRDNATTITVRINKNVGGTVLGEDRKVEDIKTGDTLTFTESGDPNRSVTFTMTSDMTDMGTYVEGQGGLAANLIFGSSGDVRSGQVCDLTTDAKAYWDSEDAYFRRGSGRLYLNGYARGDDVPDALIAGVMRGRTYDAFDFRTPDDGLSTYVNFKLQLSDTTGTANFSSTGSLAFFAYRTLGDAGYIEFALRHSSAPDTNQTGIRLQTTSNGAVAGIGGAIAGSNGTNVPAGCQIIAGPPLTAASQNSGIALQRGASDDVTAYETYFCFQDPLSATTKRAGYGWDNANQSLVIDPNLAGRGGGNGNTIHKGTSTWPDLAGTGVREHLVDANGVGVVISTTQHFHETVSVPAGTSYTAGTITFPIADGQTVRLVGKATAKRTDGGAVGAFEANVSGVVNRNGSTYTVSFTGGVSQFFNLHDTSSIGTGSTLNMRCTTAGGVLWPTFKQQSGETWTWFMDWEYTVI